MDRVSLLGVSQVTPVEELAACLEKWGIMPVFYEQEADSVGSKDASAHAGKDNFPADPILVFSEFWLTRLIVENEKNHRICKISENALRASRSKLFISCVLKKNNIPCVHRRAIKKHMDEFLNPGTVVRPDCAYSGKGVKYITEKISYSQYIKDASGEITATTKKVLGKQTINFIEEEFMSGDEYSCDVIISPNGRRITRVCLKAVKWIFGYPCTMAYMTVTVDAAMESAILSWCDALFNRSDDLSFAHFDFIKAHDGTYYPIDFSARPGGGLSNLLSFALPGHNLYADSIAFALGRTDSISFPNKNCAMFSFIATQHGKLKEININWPQRCRIIKKYNIGDNIPLRTLSSASARIVSIISQVGSPAEFRELADNIPKYISVSCE